jgi:23S rRNA maturation-related 3'-5' exoribonuclease YhaM
MISKNSCVSEHVVLKHKVKQTYFSLEKLFDFMNIFINKDIFMFKYELRFNLN